MFDTLLSTIGLWLPGVVVMSVLTIVSGFLSGSETALFSLEREDLQAFRNGTKSQKQVLVLLSDPARLLTVILFWNLVINLSYFAVSVVVARRLAAEGASEAGWFISLMGVVSLTIFGEVMPKSVAAVFPKISALFVVWPMLVLVRLINRILPYLLEPARALQRGFWPGLKEEALLTAVDLEKAVDLSSQSSEMIQQERQILHHILDLQEITVEELMRPRGTYVTVSEPLSWKSLGGTSPPGDLAAIVEPGTDQIYGAFWFHDHVYDARKGLKSYRESVVFIPWCAKASYCLKLMREKVCHIAVVVDEYGQTLGVLSQQDLLDTIFSVSAGRQQMILKREALLKIGDETYHVDGLTTLRFLAQHLNLPYNPDEEPSVTVAGLLHQLLRRFPEVGDECCWQGWKLRVFEVSGPSRIRVLLEKAAEPAANGGKA